MVSLDGWARVRAGILIAALVVSGCQTTGTSDYTEWEDILEPQSILEVKALQNALYYVWRKRRNDSRRVQEKWTWSNGVLFVSDLYPGMYYYANFSNPDFLVEQFRTWTIDGENVISVDRSDVKFAKDRRNNRVPYAVVTSTDGSRVCFLAARATRFEEGGATPGTGMPTGGYIKLMQCEMASNAGDVDAFTKKGLALIDDIKLRK